jgi:hypothetical protein
MVAGRRFWGDNEQHAAQHQPRRRGDLGVEAVVEDGLGAGEAGGLNAGVQARRQVDQQNDGEAEQAEQEDDPPQTAAPLVVDRGKCKQPGNHGQRDQ